MKAAYYNGVQDIRLEEKEMPRMGEDELLIKVKACAICGTDLRIYQYGHFKIQNGIKRVLGHETAGVVEKAGAKVKGFERGMKVAVLPNVGCGTCPECIRGFNTLCADYKAFGVSMDGGFQEYMVIPAFAVAAGAVIRIPDALTFEEAALAEPFSCVYRSYEALQTRPGETVLVIGAGPIGCMHAALHKLAGAVNVIAASTNLKRLQAAQDFGADALIHSADIDIVQVVKEVNGGRGADVVITACSVPKMQQLALEAAASRGRINFFGGLPDGKEQVLFNSNLIHYKELTVLGTTGSGMTDFYNALRIIASGRADLKKLVSRRFGLGEIKEAFEYAASGVGMKTLIVYD